MDKPVLKNYLSYPEILVKFRSDDPPLRGRLVEDMDDGLYTGKYFIVQEDGFLGRDATRRVAFFDEADVAMIIDPRTEAILCASDVVVGP